MNRRELLVAGTVGAGLAACAPKQSADAKLSDGAPSSGALSPDLKRAALSGFAVNVESWWRDMPFEARFDKAAAAGFSHVEFWFIDSWKRSARELKSHIPEGLGVAQIVGDAPELARPETRAEFLENCKRAVDNADILGTDIVTLTGHQDVEGISAEDALKSYQDHMAAAVGIFEDAQVYAAIEPFNPYNHPGHFIYGHVEALRICQEISSPFMKINWDLFHMQRHEGNLIDNFRKGAEHVCYVQIADSPDRHQPGTGEIDHAGLLRAVREMYQRPIGLELWAKDDDYEAALLDIVALSRNI